jgi:hypothetical protein
MWQQEAAAFAALRRDGDIHPDPFIPIIDDPRWPVADGTPTSPEPALQSEPPLVEGDDPCDRRRFQGGGEVC